MRWGISISRYLCLSLARSLAEFSFSESLLSVMQLGSRRNALSWQGHGTIQPAWLFTARARCGARAEKTAPREASRSGVQGAKGFWLEAAVMKNKKAEATTGRQSNARQPEVIPTTLASNASLEEVRAVLRIGCRVCWLVISEPVTCRVSGPKIWFGLAMP